MDSPAITDEEGEAVKMRDDEFVVMSSYDTHFCYVVRSHKDIKEERVHSPYFTFGSYKWRLLIFPRGNKPNTPFISVFLDCGGPAVDSTPPPEGWRRHARFSLSVVHPSSAIYSAAVQHDARKPHTNFCDLLDVFPTVQRQHVAKHLIKKKTSHTFTRFCNDWGFPELAHHAKLTPGHFCDDKCNVVILAHVRLEDRFPEESSIPDNISLPDNNYAFMENIDTYSDYSD